MAAIPRITTERLLLRGSERRDFEAFAGIVMDPTRPAGPVDRRQAWRMFQAGPGAWVLDGTGWWSVEERATGAFVGSVGAFHREPAPSPNGPDELELGWSLVEAARGLGFATEAARAMVEWASDAKRPRRLIAHIDHDNAASIRVAEKIGMTFEGDTDFYGDRVRRYVR